LKQLLIKSFWKSRNLFSKRFLAAGGKSGGPKGRGVSASGKNFLTCPFFFLFPYILNEHEHEHEINGANQ